MKIPARALAVIAAIGGVGCGDPQLTGNGTQATGNTDGGLALTPPAGDGAFTVPDLPTCAEESYAARPAALDLHLVVDSSDSMTQPLNGGAAGVTKWKAVREALAAFAHDPRSAGLGVGLQYFPLRPPAAVCDLGQNSTPSVGIGDLPAAEPAIAGSLQDRVPGGYSPLGVAVSGALAYLRSPPVEARHRRAALVIATDGAPNQCSPADIGSIAIVLSTARDAKPPITTYVIGVLAKEELATGKAAVDWLASSGGSGAPLIASAESDLSDRFLAALNDVRAAALPCEYGVPTPAQGTVDYGSVNLWFTPSGGTAAVIVGNVAGQASCHPTKGGWYYDVDPGSGTPTRISVCPTTCFGFKQDRGAQVEIRVGCKTKPIE